MTVSPRLIIVGIASAALLQVLGRGTILPTTHAAFLQPSRRTTSRTWSPLHLSDVPRSSSKSSNNKQQDNQWLQQWKEKLPPPPEDQFVMTGDIAVLFMYVFLGHSVNNMVVKSTFATSSLSEAVASLDPLGERVSHLQAPVWMAAPEDTLRASQVVATSAQEALMDHFHSGLLESAGSASIAFCLCWLMAGWLHRSFLFRRTLDCDPGTALVTTLQTWMTMVGLLIALTVGSDWILHQLNAASASAASTTTSEMMSGEFPLTNAELELLFDSASVLFCWRYMANYITNTYFR